MWPGLKRWQNVHFWGLFHTTSLWSAAVSIDTLWKTTTTRQVVNHALSSLSGVGEVDQALSESCRRHYGLYSGADTSPCCSLSPHTRTHTPTRTCDTECDFFHTHTELIPTCVCFFFHIRLVLTKTHGWRRKQKGRWQNKKRKGKLSFSTCQSWGCQSVTRILTIIGCHHSVIRTASGETVGRRAEDWQSSPSSPYSSAGRVTFVIYTHTAVLEGSKSNMSEEPCATQSECYRHTEAQRV